MNKPFSFGKQDRLKSRKLIDELFAEGNSISCSPIRVIYLIRQAESSGSLQAGVTASKRIFKRSVQRNRLKRLLKEAYRLQKTEISELFSIKKMNGYLFLMYTDKNILSFEIIKDAMAKCLKKLNQKLNEGSS